MPFSAPATLAAVLTAVLAWPMPAAATDPLDPSHPALQPAGADPLDADPHRTPTASAPLAIELSPPNPGPAMPLQVIIAGWSGQDCAPAVSGVERRGNDVTVQLEPVRKCDPGAAPASLSARAPAGMRWGGSGVFRVRVHGEPLPGGEPRVLGFRLLQVGPTPPTMTPEAGYWWNEAGGEFDHAGPGLGLNLERQGDTLSVTVLGYADDGRPEWLFGAGPIDGRIARVPLSRLHDGGGPFLPYRAPGGAQPAGVLHFEFASEARAAVWFERAGEHGLTLRPLSLVRFRFDDTHAHAALGDWLFVTGAVGDGEAPLSLRFDRAEPTADGFRVLTAAGTHALECLVDPVRPNSPAERCVLSDAEGVLLVDFRDIALQRMRGWRPDGARITALRSPAD